MAAPRATSCRAIKNLARLGIQTRQLHMTGAAAQPRLPSYNKMESLQCAPALDKQDSFHPFSPSTSPRYFNTSRVHKAVGDSSTIDFAYLPKSPMPLLDYESADMLSRVPILPAYSSSSASNASDHRLDGEMQSSLKPTMTISTAAGEATHIHTPSAMSDVHDGHHEATDFHEVVATIASGADAVKDAGKGELRKVKGLWSGLMEDIFGPKTPVA